MSFASNFFGKREEPSLNSIIINNFIDDIESIELSNKYKNI